MALRLGQSLSMKTNNSVTKLFCELVSIPSPSGDELNVGKFIKNYLNNSGIKAVFDKTGKLNQSNAGNLIAKIKGTKGQPTVLFVAHMDTVEIGDVVIKPIISKGVIKSDGKTILGADDKGSVAALMEAIVEINKWKVKPTIVAVFSTREEKGEMGISLFETGEKIDFAFSLDGAAPQGGFLYKALGQLPFQIEIFGKASHSAIAPEKGKNAILTASRIVSKLPLGKLSEDVYINVGKISGGQSINIVPDKTTFEGEIRAYLNKEMSKYLDVIKNLTKKICIQTGCTYKITTNSKEGTPPMFVPKDDPIIKVAQNATKKLNLHFKLLEGKFTCEANFLAQKYPVLNICKGGKMPHSTDESITIDELLLLKDLILELAKCVNN